MHIQHLQNYNVSFAKYRIVLVSFLSTARNIKWNQNSLETNNDIS